MNYLKLKSSEQPPALTIEPGKKVGAALLLHGYGGSKEEMLPLSVNLASAGIFAQAVDLPGHGRNLALFTYENALNCLTKTLEKEAFQLIIGHSIGARLALMSGLPSILISPPSAPEFTADRERLVRTLRCHRVREREPYAGLREVMAKTKPATRKSRAEVVIYGSRDLRTVKDFAAAAGLAGCKVIMVKGGGHLDIVSEQTCWQRVVESALRIISAGTDE